MRPCQVCFFILFIVLGNLNAQDVQLTTTRYLDTRRVVLSQYQIINNSGLTPSPSLDLSVSDLQYYTLVRDQENVDIFWLTFGSCLVFLMQIGFTFMAVGSVGSKNTKAILLKNVIDLAVCAITFWAAGWAFAFGNGNSFVGYDGFFMTSGFIIYETNPDTGAQSVYYDGLHYAKWMFAFQFCAVATTIVSGPTAERIQVRAYIIYAIVMSLWVYPFVAHWAWSPQGWASSYRTNDRLFNSGVIDFAGDSVVHIVGGTASLVACIILGARAGRFSADGEVLEMFQQSSTYQTIGAFLLWVGWYGFNAVSTQSLSAITNRGDYSDATNAAMIVVVTTLGAAAGCISSILVCYFHEGHLNSEHANNGIIAGLISITGCCSVVETGSAIIIGLVSGPVYYYSTKLLLKFYIDDVVQAAPLHLFCGFWGLIATGLFTSPLKYKNVYHDYEGDTPCGIFYGCSGNLLLANFVFSITVMAWVGANMVILFSILKYLGILRIPYKNEETGMDQSFFKSRDNAEFVTFASWNEKVVLALLSSPYLTSDLRSALTSHPSFSNRMLPLSPLNTSVVGASQGGQLADSSELLRTSESPPPPHIV